MSAFQLFHISDLHIGRADVFKRLEVLEAAITKSVGDQTSNREILPRILVISGDLVDTPTTQLLQEARKWLDGFSDSFDHTIIVPGNHDVKRYGVGGVSKSQFNSIIDQHRLPIFAPDHGLHVVPLDSTPAFLAQGEVEGPEFDAMTASVYASELVSKMPEDLKATLIRMLVVHHHPLPLVQGEDQKVLNFTVAGAGLKSLNNEQFMFLRNPARLLHACLDSSVRLVLHGHRHVSGIAKYSIPDVSDDYDQFWRELVVLSSPSSTGMDYPAGFNEILALPHSGLKVRRWVRPYNSGNFQPLDRNPNAGWISLDSEVRDIDIAVLTEYRLGMPGLSERQRVDLSGALFRRRAFSDDMERDWNLYSYALAKTRLVWQQNLVGRYASKQGNRAAVSVERILDNMIDHVCSDVYAIERGQFDDLSMKHLSRKPAFVHALPSFRGDSRQLEVRRQQYIKQLQLALKQCGVEVDYNSPDRSGWPI